MSAPSKTKFLWVLIVIGAMGAAGFLSLFAIGFVAGFKKARDESQGVEWVDEAYRFKLSPPGKGWRVLSLSEARAMNPTARAAAIHGNGLFAMVTVEAVPSTTLEDYAKSLRSLQASEDTEVVYTKEETFAGVPAIREGLVGTFEGHRIRFDRTLFVTKGHGYQVAAWGTPNRTDSNGDFGEPIRAAFSLLPGEVDATDVGPAILTDFDGSSHRVRQTVWESASAGLRVDTAQASGWRPATRSEHVQIAPEADGVFVHTAPDVYLALVSRPAIGPAPREIEDEDAQDVARQSGWEPVEGEAFATRFGDMDLALAPHRIAGSFPADLRLGTTCDATRCFRIWYWNARDIEGDEEQVASLLAQVTRLDDKERNALREALQEAPDPDTAYTPDAALRRGVYRNGALGIRWSKPHRGWSATVALSADVPLEIELREAAVRGSLSRQEGTDPAEVHAVLAESWGMRPLDRPEPFDRNGRRFYLSELADPVRSVLVATTEHRGSTWAWELFGRKEHMARARPQLLEAVANLTFERPSERTQEESGKWQDGRLGFSFRAPSGWTRTALEVESMPELASAHAWHSGNDRVEVLVLPIPSTTVDVDFMQQSVVEGVVRAVAPTFQLQKVKLQSRPFQDRQVRAVHHRVLLRDVAVLSFVDDGRIFVLYATTQGLGNAPVDVLEQGLTLLDP